MKQAIVEFDGACQPNGSNGQGGFGFVIRTPGSTKAHQQNGRLRPFPGLCAQVAEWAGALRGIHYARKRYSQLTIRGDSQFVIDSLGSSATPHLDGKFKRLYRATMPALTAPETTFEWIDSAQNTAAHELANLALRDKEVADYTNYLMAIMNNVQHPVPISEFRTSSEREQQALQRRLYQKHRHRTYSLLVFCAKSRQLNIPNLEWTDHHAVLSTMKGEDWPRWSSKKVRPLSRGRSWYELSRHKIRFQALYNKREIRHFEDIRSA